MHSYNGGRGCAGLGRRVVNGGEDCVDPSRAAPARVPLFGLPRRRPDTPRGIRQRQDADSEPSRGMRRLQTLRIRARGETANLDSS